jgi:hypothetical protein
LKGIDSLIGLSDWRNILCMSRTPTDLTSFFKLADGLRELEVTIGPEARPVVAEVRSRLEEAARLRENADLPAALEAIQQAMTQLATLAGKLDPAEGMLMKAIADRFTAALNLGDKGLTKETVNFIRHRAGDPKDDPNVDW